MKDNTSLSELAYNIKTLLNTDNNLKTNKVGYHNQQG